DARTILARSHDAQRSHDVRTFARCSHVARAFARCSHDARTFAQCSHVRTM
ncbi:hypothetical protein EAI_08613, partial [Harpegnathos saltator]